MMRNFPAFLAFILVLTFVHSKGQQSIKDESITIPMVYASYAYQFPGADMADRFGTNSSIGPGFQVKTASNWIFGLETNFIFGNNFKPGFSIFKDIMTSDGNIINGDGLPAVVALFERGFIISGKFGKLFPVLSPNPNSGIVVYGTIGYMQHKLRIDVENNSAPQLLGDYKKGYDRLTGGFAISEAIGYQIMGNSRILNFFFGVEFHQGWTKSKREYLFDLKGADKTNRFEILFGPKISWFIPIYQRAPEEYYFY